MRSRWYHTPLIHSLGREKRATWLEVFYDLIFVAAFLQLGNELGAHPNRDAFLGFAGLFLPLWVTWTGFALYVNRFSVDDFFHRILVFVQMFAVGGMAVGAPHVFQGDGFGFGISAGAAQCLVAALYLRTFRQIPEARGYCAYWGLVYAASGSAWFVAAFLPLETAKLVGALASLLILLAPMSRASRAMRQSQPLDMSHLGERYGLLTVFVLGESFVTVIGGLTRGAPGVEAYLGAAFALLIAGGVWWVYFDDVAGSGLRGGPGRWMVWLYSHLPLQMGAVAVGVGVKGAVFFSFDEPAPSASRWLCAGALAMVYFAVAAIDSVTERGQVELSDKARVNARLVSGVVLLVLAPAGGSMSGGMFLTMLCAVVAGQVVFDMAMAPLEQHEDIEREARALGSPVDRSGQRPRRRRDVSDAVRKGAPSELRRDFYFYLIEGSWLRVFVSLAVLFVFANVFFAALYVMEPGSVANTRPNNFFDAFYFSVQTMSTIGYGAMAPASDWAHNIVTIEAAFSLLTAAIITGLVFAKVSRPRAAVLFSEPLCVSTFEGKPAIIFRAGNARGNEIVDASLDFTAVLESQSEEGPKLRRLTELKLIRNKSPMFVLTWTAIHVIDDDSPLKDLDWDNIEQHVALFVATLVGHDGTYGQTVFARKTWYAEDVKQRHHFVDILRELPDGRIMIDYTLFHDTESE